MLSCLLAAPWSAAARCLYEREAVVFTTGPVLGVPISQCASERRSRTVGSMRARSKEAGGCWKVEACEVPAWYSRNSGEPSPKCDSRVLL